MDVFESPCSMVTFTSWILTMIMDVNQSFVLLELPVGNESDNEANVQQFLSAEDSSLDTYALFNTTLNSYRLYSTMTSYTEDVAYWVKPWSTTWFSRFLVEQYGDKRWISMFRMTKKSIFSLSELLKPHVEKQNTKYQIAIPVLIRVACTLFKLTHGANLTICSEMFAVGRSTMNKMLREVVFAINETLKHEIKWPTGDKLCETQARFASLCSLPAVVGAIDGMHISITKPDFYAADYYYFKTGGYSVNCQAIVDSDKQFLDLFVDMPSSTNDSRMLRCSKLHYLASHGQLLDASQSVDGHTPYLIGDLGCPLLPWLMVPHKNCPDLSPSELLFNKKLHRARSVVENAFGILKQSFKELLEKSDLHLTFLPDVVVACAILHNVLLRQSHEEVENLLEVLYNEGLPNAGPHVGPHGADGGPRVTDDTVVELATEKKRDLGTYLTNRRRPT